MVVEGLSKARTRLARREFSPSRTRSATAILHDQQGDGYAHLRGRLGSTFEDEERRGGQQDAGENRNRSLAYSWAARAGLGAEGCFRSLGSYTDVVVLAEVLRP